ncbi:MAG TPA: hypothetical protein DIS93_08190 [Bdellovibrionales bacterium]|nr:hypothetical protein [Bdellovibrionales bacterium]
MLAVQIQLTLAAAVRAAAALVVQFGLRRLHSKEAERFKRMVAWQEYTLPEAPIAAAAGPVGEFL